MAAEMIEMLAMDIPACQRHPASHPTMPRSRTCTSMPGLASQKAVERPVTPPPMTEAPVFADMVCLRGKASHRILRLDIPEWHPLARHPDQLSQSAAMAGSSGIVAHVRVSGRTALR